MGIQDRDYYWEKHKQASKGNRNGGWSDSVVNQTYHSPRRQSRNGGILYLLYPIIAIVGLWYGASEFLKRQETAKTRPPASSFVPVPSVSPEAIGPISGGIILKTDQQGHFRGTVLINNVAMPFLVDTGATKTSIPEKFAVAAGLPFGGAVQANTAGGTVMDRLTRINNLKIGNAELRNLDGNINGYLDEVLIGMNTLKYFHMTQSGNTLTLVANNAPESKIASANVSNFPISSTEQPVKKTVKVKKTVTCDEHNVCVTKYSDR